MAILLSFDEKYDPQNGRPKWPDFWNFLANPRISIPCWDWSDEILRKLLLACLLHQWFLHFHFQIYLHSVPLIMKISISLTVCNEYSKAVQKIINTTFYLDLVLQNVCIFFQNQRQRCHNFCMQCHFEL